MPRIIDNGNKLPFFIGNLNNCNRHKHRHEYVQIVYVCKGRLRHVLNQCTYEVCEGDLFVIPPYVPHYYVTKDEENFRIIELEFIPEFINEHFSPDDKNNSFPDSAYLTQFFTVEYLMRPKLSLTGGVKIFVESILYELLREYEEKQSDFTLMYKSLLLQLLVLIGREYRKTFSECESLDVCEQHRDDMLNAIRYVNTHYNEELTSKEVAEKTMLSQSYFRFLFKQLTGKTLTDYINSIRISKAAEMLKSKPGIRIIDVCYQTGFKHVNYFNKIFLREIGVPPSAYRKTTGNRAG
jgi:AraC-like DNA-binding protein